MPENYRFRITWILNGMKNIFKVANSESGKSASNPPTSLVESYIELTLLADESF